MRDLKTNDWEASDTRSTKSRHLRIHCETDESYKNVLATSGNHRIAICKRNMQWLFQRRRPSKEGAGARWDNIGYCITRTGLMRLQRSENAELEEFIKMLPPQKPQSDEVISITEE